jgi:hypothetical protein
MTSRRIPDKYYRSEISSITAPAGVSCFVVLVPQDLLNALLRHEQANVAC